jgi:hypothetical protein
MEFQIALKLQLSIRSSLPAQRELLKIYAVLGAWWVVEYKGFQRTGETRKVARLGVKYVKVVSLSISASFTLIT